MKRRALWMDANFLAILLSEPGAWQIIKNRLPEGCKFVGGDIEYAEGRPTGVKLWFESSAFLDSDPDDLDGCQFLRLPAKP